MRCNFFRKVLPGAFCLFLAALLPQAATAQVQQPAVTAQQIADHFSAIRRMTGRFVQIDARGNIEQGTFYLERPGKARFTYDDLPVTVVANGKSVVIYNKKLDTWSLYSLSQTPLQLLLADRIDLQNSRILGFRQEPNVVSLLLESKGKIRIDMVFDPKTLDLREWSVIDRKNQRTTVQLLETRTEGFVFGKGMFDIPKNRQSQRSGLQ